MQIRCTSHIFPRCSHKECIDLSVVSISLSSRSAKRATSFPAGARRQTNTNGIPYLNRYGTTTSSRARFSLQPRLERPAGSPLFCPGDEIRYFVKVISPRKVSFRRVIASAPFPPTAAALHATRAREKEEGKRGDMKRGPSRESRTVGIAGRDSALRVPPMANRGLEVKDQSVTLIEKRWGEEGEGSATLSLSLSYLSIVRSFTLNFLPPFGYFPLFLLRLSMLCLGLPQVTSPCDAYSIIEFLN